MKIIVPSLIVVDIEDGAEDTRAAVAAALPVLPEDSQAALIPVLSGAFPQEGDQPKFVFMGEVMVLEQKGARVKQHGTLVYMVKAVTANEAQQMVFMLAERDWKQRYPVHTKLTLARLAGPFISLTGPLFAQVDPLQPEEEPTQE